MVSWNGMKKKNTTVSVLKNPKLKAGVLSVLVSHDFFGVL